MGANMSTRRQTGYSSLRNQVEPFTSSSILQFQRRLPVAAMAAARTKGIHVASQNHRLSGRRGKMRARKAVGHTILIAAWHILSDPGITFVDLGLDWFDRRNSPELRARRKLSELRALGCNVITNDDGDIHRGAAGCLAGLESLRPRRPRKNV